MIEFLTSKSIGKVHLKFFNTVEGDKKVVCSQHYSTVMKGRSTCKHGKASADCTRDNCREVTEVALPKSISSG